MATNQANPKKKGFQGVQAAIWIIVFCFIAAVAFYKFVLGNPANFVDGNPENAVKDGSLLGLVYKGGIVVPVIITLLFTYSWSWWLMWSGKTAHRQCLKWS